MHLQCRTHLYSPIEPEQCTRSLQCYTYGEDSPPCMHVPHAQGTVQRNLYSSLQRRTPGVVQVNNFEVVREGATRYKFCDDHVRLFARAGPQKLYCLWVVHLLQHVQLCPAGLQPHVQQRMYALSLPFTCCLALQEMFYSVIAIWQYSARCLSGQTVRAQMCPSVSSMLLMKAMVQCLCSRCVLFFESLCDAFLHGVIQLMDLNVKRPTSNHQGRRHRCL